jgi:hypothetical protein
MNWELAVAVVSAVVGIAAAWFGFVAVHGQLRPPPRPPAPIQPAAAQSYDAFISYASHDERRAEKLAVELQRQGLRVFLAKWIAPGLVEYLEKERALSASINGILVFSRLAMRDPRMRDDYAAALDRAHSDGRRLIPVKIDDVDLPPYAKIRKALDLTGHGNHDVALEALVRAIRA